MIRYGPVAAYMNSESPIKGIYVIDLSLHTIHEMVHIHIPSYERSYQQLMLGLNVKVNRTVVVRPFPMRTINMDVFPRHVQY